MQNVETYRKKKKRLKKKKKKNIYIYIYIKRTWNFLKKTIMLTFSENHDCWFDTEIWRCEKKIRKRKCCWKWCYVAVTNSHSQETQSSEPRLKHPCIALKHKFLRVAFGHTFL